MFSASFSRRVYPFLNFSGACACEKPPFCRAGVLFGSQIRESLDGVQVKQKITKIFSIVMRESEGSVRRERYSVLYKV